MAKYVLLAGVLLQGYTCSAFWLTAGSSGLENGILHYRSRGQPAPTGMHPWMHSVCARRALLAYGVALGNLALSGPAEAAFENRQVALFPSLKGVPYGANTPVPSGVGVASELRGCPSTDGTARPAPNCFSSTSPEQPAGSDQKYYVAPFAYTGKDATQAMEDLLAAAKAYPPGQAKIDAGGWTIVKQTNKYLYMQFESGGIGYIDDLEFMLEASTQRVMLRTASRTGFLDFAVNAKRVNWFAGALAAKGWATTLITPDDHPDYFNQNGSQ